MEYGHFGGGAKGFFIDSWGDGNYILTISGKTYRFEDSDRFGPQPIDASGEPTNRDFPARAPFWKAWERWKLEGRKFTKGKGGWLHCKYSDLRKPTPIYDGN